MQATLEQPLLAERLKHPSHAAALAWARTQFQVRSVEALSHSGWATTYRLVCAKQRVYLKVLPQGSSEQVQRLQAVAEHFPRHVPPVLAVEPGAGWLLVRDHQGHEPDLESPGQDVESVLRTFAQMQARATTMPQLLARLPRLTASDMCDRFLAFLSAPALPQTGSNAVGLAYFLGPQAAARYCRLFSTRAALLRSHTGQCTTLPDTLVHGDLHVGNVGVTDQGRLSFIDWDEAGVGVAGMCLHGLLGGVALPSVLLGRMQVQADTGDTPLARQVLAYVEALVDARYASRERVLQALPGAMCLGQMQFITSFGSYPGEDGRRHAARTLQTKLSDLLDLCDWLVSRDLASSNLTIDDYEHAGEWRRALRLAQDQVARHPDNARNLARFARLCWREGAVATAEEAWKEVLTMRPLSSEQRAQAHHGLAQVACARMDLQGARVRVRQARALAPELPGLDTLVERLSWMTRVLKVSRSEKGWPRVALTAEERKQGRLAPDTLALLLDVFAHCGAVQVDEAFELDHVQRLQAAFKEGYAGHFHDGAHDGALQVGDKRWMLTMRLDEHFGAPELLASPLLGFFDKLLGPECILSAYTAVVSLPGSADQVVHKDHSALFEEAGWQLEHPAFAAQIVLPLLELNGQTGATRIFKGTQRIPLNRLEGRLAQDPVVPLGSCVLLDYSVSHYGIGNSSKEVRPILNMVYSRPWFRDCRNYYLQPPLRFDQHFLSTAGDDVRRLVSWWDLERKAATLD